jgi:hypothetical protein
MQAGKYEVWYDTSSVPCNLAQAVKLGGGGVRITVGTPIVLAEVFRGFTYDGQASLYEKKIILLYTWGV